MTIFSEVLIFAAFWLFAVLSTLFYMHMFQLNSYRADDQWHWMLKNRGKVVPLALPLIVAYPAAHHHPAYNPNSLRDTLPSQTCHFRASQPHSNTFSVADIITRYNEKCIFRYICP